jgi:hypothetical protein
MLSSQKTPETITNVPIPSVTIEFGCAKASHVSFVIGALVDSGNEVDTIGRLRWRREE